MSRWTEFASGFCPGGHYSLACIFHFTEYVPPLPPIIQGQTVSPSHVVALSHVPCHGTISIPCHGTISIPCHGTISIPCHGTISIPCHVSLTLSDDVVCTVWFLYVGCVMYIPLQDKKWEGWLINPVIVFLCGNYGTKICVQYSSLFYKTLLHHSVHFPPPMPPPHPNLLSHICTPFHPNHSSLILFVCCSSVGVSSVAIIMSHCLM